MPDLEKYIVVVTSLIHFYSIALHSQHLDIRFKITPTKSNELSESKIFLFQPKLINIEVLRDNDVAYLGTLIRYCCLK